VREGLVVVTDQLVEYRHRRGSALYDCRSSPIWCVVAAEFGREKVGYP